MAAVLARRVRRAKETGHYEVNESAFADQIVFNSYPELNGGVTSENDLLFHTYWDDGGKGMMVVPEPEAYRPPVSGRRGAPVAL